MMHPLHPLFALIIFVIAVTAAWLLNKRFKIKFAVSRFENIDGLRGFLAIGVFMHHAAIWYQYIHTGIWEAPRSNFYNFLGQGCVVFFFMITSFLFVTKLIDSKEKEFDWKRFFIHRIRRIFPLYYFALAVMIILIMSASHWQLNTSLPKFLEQIFNWAMFTINKTPNINESMLTIMSNAGVVWSLPYEWLFYFALPLIALFILKSKPSYLMLAISVAFIIAFCVMHGVKWYFLSAFIGGGIAPFILKYTSLAGKIKDIHAAVVIPLCLFGVLQFESVNNWACIVLLSIIFNLVAMGRSVFGIFKNKTLQFLGDISYSTYLLHGMILFGSFYFIIGIEKAATLSTAAYCGIIFMITPAVVLLSFLSFKFIEKPFLNKK